MVKFIRRDAARFSKFGKGRGKKAKWRKPTGRDNKMREKIKGHPVSVSIGYGTPKSEEKITIFNAKELESIKKDSVIVLGRVGKKNKIEIAKVAKDKKIKFENFNAESFLKKLEKENKKNELKK